MIVQLCSNETFLAASGFAQLLDSPRSWLGGLIFSTPVIDPGCTTPSMEYNCFGGMRGPSGIGGHPRDDTDALPWVGDPDTGNCSLTKTKEQRYAACVSSYMTYFDWASDNITDKAAVDTYKSQENFLRRPDVNPLRYASKQALSTLPPTLLLGATRDYYYSDTPDLAARLCEAGVDVKVYNAQGAFHDWIEYSEGCFSGRVNKEAVEAYARIADFAARTEQARIVRASE